MLDLAYIKKLESIIKKKKRKVKIEAKHLESIIAESFGQ